jgi:hypothetical protein
MMNNFFNLERESRSREKTDNTGCLLDREHETSEEKEHCCSLISMRRAREKKEKEMCFVLFFSPILRGFYLFYSQRYARGRSSTPSI